MLETVASLPGTRAITNRVALAYRAASGDEAAREALALLPTKEFQATVSSLAYIAEGGGGASAEEQAQAKNALVTIRQMRATGVKRRKSQAALVPTPREGALQAEPPGLPKVKSFRRID